MDKQAPRQNVEAKEGRSINEENNISLMQSAADTGHDSIVQKNHRN